MEFSKASELSEEDRLKIFIRFLKEINIYGLLNKFLYGNILKKNFEDCIYFRPYKSWMNKILLDSNKIFDKNKFFEISYKWYEFLIDSNLDLTLIDYLYKLYYSINRVPERYRNEIMKIRLRCIEKIIFNKN